MDAEQARLVIIRDLIMDSIADDFESFETICDSVDRWDSEKRNIKPDIFEVERGLLQLIEAGLANAYALTNTIEKIDLRDEILANLNGLYFYLSREGLEVLRMKSEKAPPAS